MGRCTQPTSMTTDSSWRRRSTVRRLCSTTLRSAVMRSRCSPVSASSSTSARQHAGGSGCPPFSRILSGFWALAIRKDWMRLRSSAGT